MSNAATAAPAAPLAAALADSTSEQILDMIAKVAEGFRHTGRADDERNNAGLRELITTMQAAYLDAQGREEVAYLERLAYGRP